VIGSRFIRKLARVNESQDHLHEETHGIIQKERSRLKKKDSLSPAVENWRKAVSSVIHGLRSRKHFRDCINVTSKEHMTGVDCFDGAKQRVGEPQDGSDAIGQSSNEDLSVVHPLVDGRLKDEAQN